MGAWEATFFGGVLLGLASTLHCSAMCGGISCSTLLLLGPGDNAGRLRHATLVQAGRVLAYTALGSVAAGLGSAILSTDASDGYRTLQWVAAVALMWAGLSMAGMMPRLVLLDAAMTRLSDTVAGVLEPVRGTPAAPLALGAIWGLNPCPMVYAALFMAGLTGSAAGGAVVMAGFGLGTLPGVIAAGWGLSALKGLDKRRSVQMSAGVLIALAGFASLYVPAAMNPFLCLTN